MNRNNMLKNGWIEREEFWMKKAEFASAHQWIGSQTRRRKPTYRKISKFWEMVEQLKAIGFNEFCEDIDVNPYSFSMSMYHSTPVRINTTEARDRLVTTIQKTIKILREKNPWAIVES